MNGSLTQRNVSPVPELVRALCYWSSDCDVSEARMDFLRDRNADSEWDFANVLVRKHGAIDVASRLVEGQIRTMRGRLDQVLQIEINITDPIVQRG